MFRYCTLKFSNYLLYIDNDDKAVRLGCLPKVRRELQGGKQQFFLWCSQFYQFMLEIKAERYARQSVRQRCKKQQELISLVAQKMQQKIQNESIVALCKDRQQAKLVIIFLAYYVTVNVQEFQASHTMNKYNWLVATIHKHTHTHTHS